MFSYAYKLKNEFQLEEEGIRNIFCGILDHATVQDCTKFPSAITNVLLPLLRDIINGICYQRYEKRLEQRKRSFKCLYLRCRRKFQRGTIIKSVFDYRFK